MGRTNDLTRHIIDTLTAAGWEVWRNNSGTVLTGGYKIHMSPAYTGDIIGFDPAGRYVHIEVKTDNDILSQGQIEMLYKVAKTKDGITCVARNKNQFDDWFSKCRRIN